MECIERIVDLNLSGVFNLVVDQRISKFDFGIRIADIFRFDYCLILLFQLGINMI